MGTISDRQKTVLELKGGREIIKEFLFDKCHYLTVVAAQLFKSQEVKLFYLEASSRVIHSAISLDEDLVIDIIVGIELLMRLKHSNDATNSMTGIYGREGRCLSSIIKLHDFDPNEYYSEDGFNYRPIQERIKKWFIDTNVIEEKKEV
ncbi:hypothetical protein [Psychromonas aquimarina]|uniref:hypothetical protein n=1 Tax=Psychromonas aquimarina TaxID=444919 RepID=UPI00048CEA55|nr:hypothetical protein [Psychromonas aquimarina]